MTSSCWCANLHSVSQVWNSRATSILMLAPFLAHIILLSSTWLELVPSQWFASNISCVRNHLWQWLSFQWVSSERHNDGDERGNFHYHIFHCIKPSHTDIARTLTSKIMLLTLNSEFFCFLLWETLMTSSGRWERLLWELHRVIHD